MKRYLSIKETAELIGVTQLTLRNWDKSGKLPAQRNPINNYRMYRREDIERFIGDMEAVKSQPQHPKSKSRKLNVRFIEEGETGN